MLCYPRCIAPALLASFVGVTAASAARAEPATAASPAAEADCLAKPNGQAAPGNHWYYRVDRTSGRHCWYQRAESGASSGGRNDAARSDAAPSRSLPARATVSPPPATVASEGDGDTASDSRDQGTVAPVLAAPPQPGWSTAAPAIAPREATTAPAADSSAPAPDSLVQRPMTADAPADVVPPAVPPRRAPVRTAPVEQAAAPVEAEAASHMPALLGAALALLIVVLGSIMARLAASLIRGRRRRPSYDDVIETTTPPMVAAEDAPALVPLMPRERDIAAKSRAPRLPRETPAAPQPRASDSADATADRSRADARVLEENVRDLLRRMRSDLFDQQSAPAAPQAPAAPAPQPTAAQELDHMLARLRAQRRKQA